MVLFFPNLFRIVCMCLALTLATATAAERRPPGELKLVVNATTVDVFDREGLLLQSLPFDGETPDEDNRGWFAVAEDMNFDGFPDVRVLFSRGNVNVYYDWWLWRPGERVFVRLDAMRDLSNPDFDSATRTIHVYERGSAASHVEGDLEWRGDDLVWIGRTVVDEAGDGEDLVIRRYLRDHHGEMRLIAEDRVRPSETDSGLYNDMDDAYYRPELPGLNFFADEPDETLDVAVLANGEWWIRRAWPDRSFLMELRRLPALEYGEDAAKRLVRSEWPLARELSTAPFPALAEKTTYPAIRAEFLDGEGADARRFVAALLFADEWSFWFVVEAAAAGADVGAMERLLLGVRDVDPAHGEFLPGYGLPVYLAGDDSPLRLSVMDALIRIKKIVAPENSPWIGSGRTAYRYDGPGAVAGEPALLFSFGADSWEKFTAERHFAVDEKGTVYEMDILAGGEYWKWEDRGCSWWGEYGLGDATLHIANYREGPSGMYFLFSFAVDGAMLYDGAATARGREGGYGPFTFSLAGDDDSVTVTVDAGSPIVAEQPDLLRLEGVFARK